MKRQLIRSNTFIRAARKYLKKNPGNAESLRETLEMLSENSFHPKLSSHKLKGKLEGSWACSAGYDLRIIFRFGTYEDKEAVYLETVGTHEEVY